MKTPVQPAEQERSTQASSEGLCSEQSRFLWPDFFDRHRPRRRLASALDALLVELNHPAKGKDEPWNDEARNFHKLATCALQKEDLQSGWSHAHEIQQLVSNGWEDGRLLAQAMALRTEAKAKLTGWRGDQIAALFGACPLRDLLDRGDWKCGGAPAAPDETKDANWPHLDEPRRQQLRRAVIEAQRTLNGEHNNNYHRIALAKSQLSFLVCALIVVLVLFAVYFYWSSVKLDDRLPANSALPGVALFGALGGIITAAYDLSRAGKRKIPESLMTLFVTTARPLVGAGAALFLYMALVSGVQKLFEGPAMTVATAFTVSFLAGFSERLVIQTASKVSGGSSKGD